MVTQDTEPNYTLLKYNNICQFLHSFVASKEKKKTFKRGWNRLQIEIRNHIWESTLTAQNSSNLEMPRLLPTKILWPTVKILEGKKREINAIQISEYEKEKYYDSWAKQGERMCESWDTMIKIPRIFRGSRQSLLVSKVDRAWKGGRSRVSRRTFI